MAIELGGAWRAVSRSRERMQGMPTAHVNALDMCANMHWFSPRAYLLDAMCAIGGATPHWAA